MILAGWTDDKGPQVTSYVVTVVRGLRPGGEPLIEMRPELYELLKKEFENKKGVRL